MTEHKQPHKFEKWEDAATISNQLWHVVYQLSVIRMAASQFPDAPKGLEGVETLITDITNLWQSYANSLVPDGLTVHVD